MEIKSLLKTLKKVSNFLWLLNVKRVSHILLNYYYYSCITSLYYMRAILRGATIYTAFTTFTKFKSDVTFRPITQWLIILLQ